MRLTAGGNILEYDGKKSTEMSGLETIWIIFHKQHVSQHQTNITLFHENTCGNYTTRSHVII